MAKKLDGAALGFAMGAVACGLRARSRGYRAPARMSVARFARAVLAALMLG